MIGIIKTNDLRNKYLASYLKEDTYIYSDNLHDFINVKTLIISPLGIDFNYYFKNSFISLIDIYATNPGITKIICLKGEKKLKEFCLENNIKLIELLDNEEFVYENALLTSEGLMKVILNDCDKSLSQYNILVLGYGYCAYNIIKYISVFNKDLDVYTKNDIEQKYIYMNNINKITNIDDLSKYDIIINTVPFPMIKEERLKTIKKDAYLYDIASFPYGFDIQKAKELNLKLNVIPGIPGTMLPKSAAMVIFENIEHYIC